MAEALVTVILEQLVSISRQQTEGGIRLIKGAKHEVEKLKSNFDAIQAALADAESRQVTENAVRDWLFKLKDISYDVEDVLDEWNTTILKLQVKKSEAENAPTPLKKVSSLVPYYLSCCKRFVARHDVAVKIKDLDRKLAVIAIEKASFQFSSITKGSHDLDRPITTSLIDIKEVHGRNEEKDRIINLLLCQHSQEHFFPIISIVGMGGIGKTTLARLAFNDKNVNTHFDKKIWVCVSESFDEMRVALAILESLTKKRSTFKELENVSQEISEHLQGKKFLLVLDDVWTENRGDWEQLKNILKCGSQESRVLVTTRKENVANVIGSSHIMSLGILSENESWSLFHQVAFCRGNENENLKQIGRKIVQKCKGLPLAIKTLASLLRFKKTFEEWQNILDSEMWEVKEVEQELFPPLLLSYYDLPSILKRCFSYCAIFPKDYVIYKDLLIILWMAQGYLKAEKNKDMYLVGEDYFETLVLHSFFQEFKESTEFEFGITLFKMHDIVHDFAKYLTKNESFAIENDDYEEFETKSRDFKFRHLMIMFPTDNSIPSSIYTKKCLRSLMVGRGNIVVRSSTGIVLSKLFDQLIRLRALDLNNQSFEEIPREIKKLKHLRYLDLSLNLKLKELPEALCELYNLQTLNISWCYSVRRLPQGIGKLINLRYFTNTLTSVRYMPKSFDRLTCLVGLGEFVISDVGYGSKACSLEYCLRNFNHLQEIGIKGLENLMDVSRVKEELYNKKNLRDLRLNFEGSVNENHEVLLEALRPPPNLKGLQIENYNGSTVFPHSIMSLTALRELIIAGCLNCEYLPPFGKLPSLESLALFNMNSVKRVGNEFLGMESDVVTSSSSVTSFPKLKSLCFSDMEEWEDWNYEIALSGERELMVMPCLETLRIINCPKLNSMPDHLRHMTMLKRGIYDCPLLQEFRRSDSSSSSSPVTDKDLSQIPDFNSDSGYVRRDNL